MTVTNSMTSEAIGFAQASTFPNTGTLALSAGSPGVTWLAISFMGQGQTLSAVSMYASAKSAAFTSGADVRASLYSSNTDGSPNAEIEQKNCSTTPDVGRLSWTGFTTALTAGVKYYIVFKNYHATSTLTLRWVTSGPQHMGAANLVHSQWVKTQTGDSGATWTSYVAEAMGLKITYSGSIYDGFPLNNSANTAGATDGVYAAREVGNLFVCPLNGKFRVVGIGFNLSTATGTPQDTVRFRLYEGSTTTPTLVATSLGTIPRQQVNNNTYCLYITPYELKPGETYRVTIGGVTGGGSAGDSSNYHRTFKFTIDDDPDSRALMPFDAYKTYTTDGTTFTNTNTEILPFVIVLDRSNELNQSSQSVYYKRGSTVMKM
jgi:hypothetical protein